MKYFEFKDDLERLITNPSCELVKVINRDFIVISDSTRTKLINIWFPILGSKIFKVYEIDSNWIFKTVWKKDQNIVLNSLSD